MIATFYNFRPELVRASIPAAWERATPDADHRRAARARPTARCAAPSPTRSGSPELAEAATLARRAAETACEHVEGRPLFAGHASLPWPDDDHLVLWHAQTLLREYRGDGHIAALVTAGLSGLEAAITHVATGDVPGAVLVSTRAWPADEWDAGVDGLRARGILEPGDRARAHRRRPRQRQWIEDVTDAAAVAAYEPLGDDGCARLRALARPWSRAIVDGGLLGDAAAALRRLGGTPAPGGRPGTRRAPVRARFTRPRDTQLCRSAQTSIGGSTTSALSSATATLTATMMPKSRSSGQRRRRRAPRRRRSR